jgi:hypothetical protein
MRPTLGRILSHHCLTLVPQKEEAVSERVGTTLPTRRRTVWLLTAPLQVLPINYFCTYISLPSSHVIIIGLMTSTVLDFQCESLCNLKK